MKELSFGELEAISGGHDFNTQCALHEAPGLGFMNSFGMMLHDYIRNHSEPLHIMIM